MVDRECGGVGRVVSRNFGGGEWSIEKAKCGFPVKILIGRMLKLPTSNIRQYRVGWPRSSHSTTCLDHVARTLLHPVARCDTSSNTE